jgi:hypothetical protein
MGPYTKLVLRGAQISLLSSWFKTIQSVSKMQMMSDKEVCPRSVGKCMNSVAGCADRTRDQSRKGKENHFYFPNFQKSGKRLGKYGQQQQQRCFQHANRLE